MGARACVLDIRVVYVFHGGGGHCPAYAALYGVRNSLLSAHHTQVNERFSQWMFTSLLETYFVAPVGQETPIHYQALSYDMLADFDVTTGLCAVSDRNLACASFKAPVHFQTKSCSPVMCYGNQWSRPMKSFQDRFHWSAPLVSRSN